MKSFSDKYIIAGLIGMFLLQSGCDKQNKWKAVPLKITKQEEKQAENNLLWIGIRYLDASIN